MPKYIIKVALCLPFIGKPTSSIFRIIILIFIFSYKFLAYEYLCGVL